MSSSPESVNCAHILVKHQESRNPSSWREPVITRTKSEAYEIINSYYDDLINNRADFFELAQNYSDCSSAKKQGNLGYFTRGQMQKAFEDVAFSTPVNSISKPFESGSGIHIILRRA